MSDWILPTNEPGQNESAMAVLDHSQDDRPTVSSQTTVQTEAAEDWFYRNTFHHSKFADIPHLVKLKRQQKYTISLAFPTLNEEETIGNEIRNISSALMKEYPLIDEIAVIDSGSKDRTRELAEEAGATVYLSSDILPEHGSYAGKGENLWKSLYVLDGDLVVWIDADIKNIHPKFVYGVLGPLLENPNVGYVKAFYERPLNVGSKLVPTGGGRVTEILVRPLLAAFYPELSLLIQPLSGEYAGRREILESVPFQVGYGVEIGHLLDILAAHGLDIFSQVDLDKRVHRNQSTEALSRMAFGILQTVMSRLEDHGRVRLAHSLATEFRFVKTKEYTHILKKEELKFNERPPMLSIPEYRAKRGLA